jgi:hypothetical protein
MAPMRSSSGRLQKAPQPCFLLLAAACFISDEAPARPHPTSPPPPTPVPHQATTDRTGSFTTKQNREPAAL